MKKRKILIVLIGCIFILLIYVSYNNKYFNKINIYFKNISSKVKNDLVINDISNDINLGINKTLEEENNELKKIINEKETNYELITAKVIDRDITWYQTITINKGKNNNLDINMAVIDSNSLIGKIIEVGDNYSIVQLITSNLTNSKLAVDIKNENSYHGILDSYDKDNNMLIIKNVNKNSDIKTGDKVYTNGLGGIYPEGIYIGEVFKVGEDSLNLAKEVKVRINNSYDNIRYVNVIRK